MQYDTADFGQWVPVRPLVRVDLPSELVRLIDLAHAEGYSRALSQVRALGKLPKEAAGAG